MEHEFQLRKPLPQRAQPDWSVKPTAEQVALVHWITAQMLRVLMEYIDLTEQHAIFASHAPFHLFELSNELCDLVGVPSGCAVLFDLVEVSPKLVWSDEDFGALQRSPVDRLRAMWCELTRYTPTACSFARLTA